MADITTVNPTTGEDIKEYNYMTNDEVNKIVDASHEAFLEWRKKSHEERAKVIKSIGDTLMKYKEELSKLMTEDLIPPLLRVQPFLVWSPRYQGAPVWFTATRVAWA